MASGIHHSSELEQIQRQPDSPFGMTFLRVPTLHVSVPAYREEANTRTCDEPTLDGKSVLDCVDDDD